MGQLKGILVGIILGALAAGGAAWWMVQKSSMQLAPIVPVPSTVAVAPTVSKAPSPAVSSASAIPPPMTPPWVNGGTADGKSPAQVEQELQASREKMARLRKVEQDYRQMVREGKQSDPAAVSHLLDQLQKAEGSSVVNGIDLSVLRNNLKVVARIKGVAQEIEVEQQSGHPDKQKLQQYLAELKQLKGQINRNFVVKTPAPATNGGEASAPKTGSAGETTPQNGK